MKKFLLFLVSIVVVICLGMTFYAFAKDEEVIKFNTTSVYLNAGETLSLDEIGFVHTNKKSETKINFNAGGEETKSIIKYDENIKKYVATEVGGTTKIVITTNNRKFKRFEINAIIGNGSKESPFQIRTEEELFQIGTAKFDITPDNDTNEALNAHYILYNDIELTTSHDSIGFDGENFNAFQGHFDGNFYTIKNLQSNSNIYGGLFGIVGENAFIENIYFENAKLTGSYNYLGTLAGVINGYVDRVGIINSNINNASQLANSYTGGLAGKVATVDSSIEENMARVYRFSLENDENNVISANGYTGGIAGIIDCANVDGVKIASSIIGGSYVGGFAGTFVASEYEGYIRESYSISTVSTVNNSAVMGALIGAVNAKDGDTNNVNSDTLLLGLYYNVEMCDLSPCGMVDFIIDINTVDGVTDTMLKSPDTFTFFYDATNSTVVKWRATIWQLTEGQYPILEYTNYSIPSNIQKPSIDNDQPTDTDDPSDNETPSTPNTPIEKPDDVNPDNNIVVDKTVMEIKTVEDFKNMNKEGMTYILTQNEYDFNNADWTPIKLKNSTVKTSSESPVVIKNVNIVAQTNFLGFFSSIVNSKISNIIFSNVTIDCQRQSLAYVGILAGKVEKKSSIDNIMIENSSINCNLSNDIHVDLIPLYVGGLVGGFDTSANFITNVKVKTEISGNIRYCGGIAGSTTNNVTIDNSSFEGTLEAKEAIGGIVGINEGVVNNCYSIATIKNVEQSINRTYLGGIAGINSNTVTNSSVNLDMTITNEKASRYFYVGGIVGYNNSNKIIESCQASGSGIKITGGRANAYIGGIAGENRGYIQKCANTISSIGSNKTNVFVGGIVSTNLEGATIKYCSASSDLYGDYVGGLVYNNADSSSIEECMITTNSNGKRPLIKGNSVAGLVNSMASGTMNNCLAITKTYGIDSDSISAGIVVSLPLSKNNSGKNVFGTITKCIVSNDFDGNGEKYIDTQADVLGSKLTTGTILDCVIDNSNAVNCKKAELDKGWFGAKKDPASKSNYLITDEIGMTSFESYSNFEMSNETNLIWYYSATEIPTLSYFLK